MNKLILLMAMILCTACTQQPQQTDIAEDVEAQLNIARLSEENGQLSAALTIYQRVYNKWPGDEVNLALGRLYYQQKEWLKAQLHLNQIPEQSELREQGNLWQAKTQLRLMKPEQALAFMPEMPNTSEWLNLKGVALDYQQRHIEAQALYQQGLQHKPMSVRLRKNLVYSYLLAGKYQQAESELNTLFELGYRNKNYDALNAMVILLQGDDEEAKRTLERYSTPLEVDQFAAQLEQLRKP